MYTIECHCNNCQFQRMISIEKGKKVTEIECPNCGCFTLERAMIVSVNTFKGDGLPPELQDWADRVNKENSKNLKTDCLNDPENYVGTTGTLPSYMIRSRLGIN